MTQSTAQLVRPSKQPVKNLRKSRVEVVEEEEDQPYEDSELVTVLYGYGRVPFDKISYLDDYTVTGGVIRDVPYAVAKHWQKGTRPDGKRPQGRVRVVVLPGDAPEETFADAMSAAGLPVSDFRSQITGADVDGLLHKLSPEQQKHLLDVLLKRVNTGSSPLIPRP